MANLEHLTTGGFRPLTSQLRLRDGIKASTLTGNVSLTDKTANFIHIDPGGSSRDVTLPAEADAAGLVFFIRNAADAAENLVIKSDAPATIDTLNQGEWGIYGCDGTSWRIVGGSALVGASIQTDTIAELTSGTGVTVDGVLLKDGGIVLADGAAIDADTINEATAGSGVTADGVLLKDGGIVCADAATLEVDTINEATGAAGVTVDGLLLKDGEIGPMADSDRVILGAGSDDTLTHNGTDTIWTHATGDLIVDNTAATKKTALRLGTDTNATAFEVRNDSDAALFAVDGAGTITANGTLVQDDTNDTTGAIVHRIGPSATEGWERRVFSKTVSPAAVETALLTLPVGHIVEAVWANVESALTGGGTTATWSIGITGDVDAYGSAAADDGFGAQGDALTKNSKYTRFGSPGAGFGASIGDFVATTEDVKLIAAATGGAAAGDTGLTVGSVKVRIQYLVMLALDDAA